MATTPNYGWVTPAPTDFVTDLPADFEVFADAVDADLGGLLGGTTNQVLAKVSGADHDFTWVAAAGGIPDTILDAKGDLIAATAADTAARLAVGADGTVLTADSVEATGLKWVAPVAGATLGANTFTADQNINGLTVGKGGGNVASNTVVGSNAVNAAATGSNNVAVGINALEDLTTGFWNVAVGSDALKENTTGARNVAVGRQALEDCTTGGRNTAIGLTACQNVTTGEQNVGINEALQSVTSGSANIAIGFNAGNLITGDFNTFIGNQAGDNLTTGSNNSGIGRDADPATATTSNSITLGNSSITSLRCQVTTISSLSDERDKTDIQPVSVGLNLVKDLKPIIFTWSIRPEFDKEGNLIENANNGNTHTGFIAQDMLAVEQKYDTSNYLKLVDESNPDRLEVAPAKLIPILVKAIQELSIKIDELETQLNG
jgi:hypothetical protein